MLTGIFTKDVIIERYADDDFAKSVAQLNLGFALKFLQKKKTAKSFGCLFV